MCINFIAVKQERMVEECLFVGLCVVYVWELEMIAEFCGIYLHYEIEGEKGQKKI